MTDEPDYWPQQLVGAAGAGAVQQSLLAAQHSLLSSQQLLAAAVEQQGPSGQHARPAAQQSLLSQHGEPE